MPTISVIVPVYKVEPYLRQCVDSILGQTFRDFELILVDDGSPDGCPAICDEYAEQDSRVKVIHKENGGLSSARNVGLDVAKGEYISFVDSDDWIARGMLEAMFHKCVEFGADLAICNVTKCIDEKRIIEDSSPMQDECFSQDDFVKKMIANQAWRYIIACSKLYHRKLFEEIRFPEGFIHEDEAIAHRIAGRCKKIVTTSEVMYFYRQAEGSITNAPLTIKRTDMLSALADRITYAAQHKWKEMLNISLLRYTHLFLGLYFQFPRNNENRLYFRRMERCLKTAYPHIAKSGEISLRHKAYLCLVRLNPAACVWLRDKLCIVKRFGGKQ